MASNEAIELANLNWANPANIFTFPDEYKSVEVLLAFVEKGECSAFDLIKAGAEIIEANTSFELMLEAFRYWKDKNPGKVRIWESANADILDGTYWSSTKKLEQMVERTLQRSNKLIAELKTTSVCMN